jgi:glycosyltransferase involved in cell wall biosynthesis
VIDIIIPTCKQREEVEPLIDEVTRTAAIPVNVIATCQPLCAAANRNRGLEQATSDPRIMIDDDLADFPPGWAARMVDVMEEYADCVMLTVELMTPGGRRGPMAGDPPRADSGVDLVPRRMLLTACIAIRRDDLRFDENYIGSGFEDDDYCAQQRAQYPEGEWRICHDVKVVHKNEMKGQAAAFEINKRYFERKWETRWGS